MRSWRWQFSRMMRLCLRWCRLCPKPGGRPSKPQRKLRELWSYWKLLLNSLYFNSLTNSDTCLDCVFEPVYWIVDNVTRWFGVVFVCLVIALTSSVLVIVYLCLLPVILNTYPLQWIVWHLTYGHWVLIMVLFHYYKATTTSPGHPPQIKSDTPSVSICKKCIVPKPARTHHCSICNTCILKMDHHCPWLNNCVGHFNHRYFFSFCLYMTMGCMYCSVSCKDMFIEAYNAVEFGGSSSGRSDTVACYPHHPRGDQRGETHQQERGQTLKGEGKGVPKSIPLWENKQLESVVWCGGDKVSPPDHHKLLDCCET
ncbi:palmitoyltransferase ZDHHC16B-like isoform X2 [Salvelinus namaycush]|uniref:Palmitoyltransferase n=1 Tax=Salvelinus namaycush TaxID=8040 RepID=A0A8U0PU11_SALNM|nr:palmitoyltransferase ZDHHC16B-like isoform X2 [Salvelinus namaycush]